MIVRRFFTSLLILFFALNIMMTQGWAKGCVHTQQNQNQAPIEAVSPEAPCHTMEDGHDMSEMSASMDQTQIKDQCERLCLCAHANMTSSFLFKDQSTTLIKTYFKTHYHERDDTLISWDQAPPKQPPKDLIS